mgnify:CR=1 FL=1
MKILDLRLVDAPWLCGARISIGDIIVFNDLSMFMSLANFNDKSPEMAEHVNLMKWYKKMLKEKVVAEYDAKF